MEAAFPPDPHKMRPPNPEVKREEPENTREDERDEQGEGGEQEEEAPKQPLASWDTGDY